MSTQTPVRAKVKASTAGALLAGIVALLFPDHASALDEWVQIGAGVVGAFAAGYFKRETRA